ncbi:MAG TPA: PEP-CTERM sorting domain-containing protein [Phycisphaerae bacterium]|nr:PEP-CTERM sorting domain-containing protein [Phycisphaerae bacterium]
MRAVLAAILTLAMVGPVTAAPTPPHGFQGLGHLPGGDFPSEARACSADGSVVVGSSASASGLQQAFRWTAATGMQPLATPSGLTMSWGHDVSADGDWVVGFAGSSFASPVGWEGVRWGPGGSLDRIAVAGAGVWAKGISGDGSIVVGAAANEAFRWTVSGDLEPLGTLYPGLTNPQSNADGISSDGQTIVGDSHATDGIGSVRDAFRWTDVAGMVPMGGAFTATGASADGSVIVGTFDNHATALFEAYRWTAGTGLVPLGGYEPDHHTRAQGVSADGSRVVGYVQSDSTDEQRAMLWDEQHGIRIIKEVLENDIGIDMTGWRLTQAWGVSDNGPTIVGIGWNPQGQQEAWRAVLPEPATLALVALGAAALVRRRRRA